MNKSLLLALSLTCLPCFGNQFDLLITITTSDNQTRSVMGSYDSETKHVTAPYSYIDPVASLLVSGEENLIVDSQVKAADGEFVAVKKLGVEIPIPVDAAAFDQVQKIVSNNNYSTTNLDQSNTVKIINTNTALSGPQAVNDLLLNRCVDLFIAHPEQRCPFGTIERGDDPDDASLFIKKASLIEMARNILYARFKTNALPRKTAITLTHDRAVSSACHSPDDQQILTLCDDGYVRIWDTNGNMLKIFPHHIDAYCARYSPNGQQILTNCNDNNVRIWDINGTLLQTLPHGRLVYHADYSPNGQQILTNCNDNNVRIWDINGTLLQTLPHGRLVYHADYSHNGQQILTVCADHNVRIWNINGTLLQTLAHPLGVTEATYSPNGQQVYTSNTLNVYIWDVNGTLLQTIAHPTYIGQVAYSPNGQQVLTYAGRKVYLWQIALAPQFGSLLDLNEAELRRLAFMTRVALNPHFTAQEIADLQPIYHNLLSDQRAWVDRHTNRRFARV